MNLFELLHQYNEHQISTEGFTQKIEEEFWLQEEYQDNPIVVGLVHTLHLIGDSFLSVDYLAGQVCGILSMFAPCPVEEKRGELTIRTRGSSEAKTEFVKMPPQLRLNL